MRTVEEIGEAIEKLEMNEQVELLRVLQRRLELSADDLTWSQLAEQSFEFWNNADDAIYDKL